MISKSRRLTPGSVFVPDRNPGYDWGGHLLMLAPLLAAALLAGFALGFHGEVPRMWFLARREACQQATDLIQLCSDSLPTLAYLWTALLFVRSRCRKDPEETVFALRLAVWALIFALLATQALKAGLGMPRPGHELPPRPFSFLPDYASFPSGHTVNIVIAALSPALWLGKKRWYFLAALLVLIVGASRLWLGRHHPVDLLGGMLVGSVAVRLIFFRKTGCRNPTGQTARDHGGGA